MINQILICTLSTITGTLFVLSGLYFSKVISTFYDALRHSYPDTLAKAFAAAFECTGATVWGIISVSGGLFLALITLLAKSPSTEWICMLIPFEIGIVISFTMIAFTWIIGILRLKISLHRFSKISNFITSHIHHTTTQEK